jgi:hypothetical protein
MQDALAETLAEAIAMAELTPFEHIQKKMLEIQAHPNYGHGMTADALEPYCKKGDPIDALPLDRQRTIWRQLEELHVFLKTHHQETFYTLQNEFKKWVAYKD